MQLSEINSRLSTVKFWHSEKTGDWSIGDWQICLASVSVIPDAVGHVSLGCSGSDGGLTVGGSAVSLAVMMPFAGSDDLQIIHASYSDFVVFQTNLAHNLTVLCQNHWNFHDHSCNMLTNNKVTKNKKCQRHQKQYLGD